eukprot:TRINITY_DN56_c0_g1_i1.p1 TRINITY_DN56_c0_g1~~TRINITY_DN56_c0_g1_i1.p1  ORF type:complete len:569 (-),score=159.14 TRINITY_DN56_c0_g1_i1:47-1498(-)
MGYLSDKFGRKSLLVIGLCSAFFSTAAICFSPTFMVAFILRFLFSIFNSNLAVGNAFVAGKVNDPELKAKAFAYIGAIYSAMRAISSAIGGFLSESILTTDPNRVFFLDRFFPTFVFGFIVQISAILYIIICLPNDKDDVRTVAPSLKDGLVSITRSPTLLRLTGIRMLGSYGNGAILVLLVVFASNTLGFSSTQSGIHFSMFGTMAVLFQVTMFERTKNLFGVRNTYRSGIICLAFGVGFLPMAQFGIGSEFNTWGLLLFFTFFISVGFMLNIPMVSLMLSNSTRKEGHGLVQGFATAAASLARGLGALLSGFIDTLAYNMNFSALPFMSVSFVYLCAFFLSLKLTSIVEGIDSDDDDEVEEEEEEVTEKDPKTTDPGYSTDELSVENNKKEEEAENFNLESSNNESEIEVEINSEVEKDMTETDDVENDYKIQDRSNDELNCDVVDQVKPFDDIQLTTDYLNTDLSNFSPPISESTDINAF